MQAMIVDIKMLVPETSPPNNILKATNIFIKIEASGINQTLISCSSSQYLTSRVGFTWAP